MKTNFGLYYLKIDVISHRMPDNFKKYIQTQEKKTHLWNQICKSISLFLILSIIFFSFLKKSANEIYLKKIDLDLFYKFSGPLQCFETLVLYVVE